MLREISYYSRMTLGVYQMSRMRLEQDPESVVRHMLANRENNFLDLMRRAVFDNPSNPYHTLFQWAGCSFGDLENSVRKEGLEATLQALRKDGVYVANDEFKGKKAIKRSGKELKVASRDFINPLVKGSFESTSGGSRSSGTLTRHSMEFNRYREARDFVLFGQFDLMKKAIVAVKSILPSIGGLRTTLNFPRRGLPYEKWYAIGGTFRGSGHYQAVTKLLLAEARLLGVPVLFPDYLPHNDFGPAARYVARRKSEGAECVVWASVSHGVRVAAAAMDMGLDISGTICLVGAEALTDAKREVMEAAGVRPFSRYGISEIGGVGVGCPQMTEGNTVHMCRDSLAAISYRKMAPLAEVELDSLMLTTLLPFAANVFVNIEMDDAGTLGPATCDCPLKHMGYTQQASEIYSYGRLTGQGMTMIGADMLRLLEHNLPQRFGGTNEHYQLVECEGRNQTEVELRVHPQVGARPDEVRTFFLTEMKKLWGGALTHRTWTQNEGVRVTIAEPYLTNKQRVNPLHLLGTSHRQRADVSGATEARDRTGTVV